MLMALVDGGMLVSPVSEGDHSGRDVEPSSSMYRRGGYGGVSSMFV